MHAVSLIGTEDEVGEQVRQFARRRHHPAQHRSRSSTDHDTVKASLETLKSLL